MIKARRKMNSIRLLIVLGLLLGVAGAAEPEPAWIQAWKKGPMNAEETKAFMKRLAQFVFDNHLKKNPKSPQRGMVYEFFDVSRKGQFDQWVQGECLDTMHDGAWFAAAMVNAYRTTGEPFYKAFLTKWQLPFYCKMLNHSDELFTAKRNDARPGAKPWGKPWAFQEGEKGFIPYFWDDGGSVSLERRYGKNPRGIRPCVDFLAGKPNPKFLLNGYSHGMSNHMAQDIGVMLQLAWLLVRDSADPMEKKLAAELAEAARNLHECRMRHHGPIPMCVSPTALANNDAGLMKRVPDPNDKRLWTPSNHYTRALRDFRPGQRMSFPGFTDGWQYQYYFSIARTGGRLPRPLAFKLIYDAYTEPMLYRYYSDDALVPPGINKADSYPLFARDGRPVGYRSDRKGPHGTPWPVGCRMGPQNMVNCGWALQALRTYPGIWEERYKREFSNDLRVYIDDPLGMGTDKTGFGFSGGPFQLGGATVTLGSGRCDFRAVGVAPADEVTFKIFSQPDAKGRNAVITLKKDKTVAAVNHKGETLRIRATVAPEKRGFTYSFHLPYTVVKGQEPWANGLEHCRYSIRVGNETRNFYLASPEAQVRAWLERELGCGLRTWEALFREVGYLPVAVGSKRQWGRFSDSGGYAHLISAAAQWLLYLEGKRDWEMHNILPVLKPKRTR